MDNASMRVRKPGGLDNLYLTRQEARSPGPGEILVKVHASSVNYHDYCVVVGKIPVADGRIPMSDGAGVVIEAGPGVTEFKAGDSVMSTFFPHWRDGRATRENSAAVPGDRIDGFAGEYVTMPATAFTAQPRGYSHAQAATLPCAAVTAWRALMVDGRLRAGEVVLVQGTGGVSLFALQFAKAAGATVIATSSSDEKLERLRVLGADHLINYRKEPKWGAAAKKWCGGVDHVVEIGGAGTLPQSISACRLGGHIALIGVLAGLSGEVPTALVMQQQIRVQGLAVGSVRDQLDMVRAIEANKIHPVIDRSFPLTLLAEAFRHQESGTHFGKIGVDI